MHFVLLVLENALIELISVLLAALVVYGATKLLWRRSIRTFFGVPPTRGAMSFFLSSIDVRPGGAVGTEPVTGGSQGTSINHLEYRAALSLAGAVQARPLVRALHALRPAEWEAAEPVVCRVEVSPSGRLYQERMAAGRADEVTDDVRTRAGQGTVVLVSSVVYNVMTKVILGEADARTSFLRQDVTSTGADGQTVTMRRRGIGIRDDSGARAFWRTDPEPAPTTTPTEEEAADGAIVQPLYEYFVIEAFTWLGRRVFLCAGTSTAGTIAAVRRLASWRGLRRDFGDGAFTVVYQMALDSVAARETEPPEGAWQRVYRFPPEKS